VVAWSRYSHNKSFNLNKSRPAFRPLLQTHKAQDKNDRRGQNPAHPDKASPDKKQNINTSQQHKANIYFCFIAGQSSAQAVFLLPSQPQTAVGPPTNTPIINRKKTRKKEII
jgi:hypothetical protein